MSLLPLKTYASPDVPLFGSGGGGGGGGANLTVSSVTASQFIKGNSFFTSTMVSTLAANTSTLIYDMPNTTAQNGLWSFNAGAFLGPSFPKANGAIFSVSGASVGPNNYFSVKQISEANEGCPISAFCAGGVSQTPKFYITNTYSNALPANIAFHQMG
jgi:hypothetical protein